MNVRKPDGLIASSIIGFASEIEREGKNFIIRWGIEMEMRSPGGVVLARSQALSSSSLVPRLRLETRTRPLVPGLCLGTGCLGGSASSLLHIVQDAVEFGRQSLRCSAFPGRSLGTRKKGRQSLRCSAFPGRAWERGKSSLAHASGCDNALVPLLHAFTTSSSRYLHLT
jgi:hypothetical protein